MHRRATNFLAATLLIGLGLVFPRPSTAEDLLVLRCTGFEAPYTLGMSSQIAGWAPSREPLMLHLDVAGRQAWIGISADDKADRDRATLEVGSLHYALVRPAPRYRPADKVTERIVVDRESGALSHMLIVPGKPYEDLKRGGKCEKVTTKF